MSAEWVGIVVSTILAVGALVWNAIMQARAGKQAEQLKKLELASHRDSSMAAAREGKRLDALDETVATIRETVRRVESLFGRVPACVAARHAARDTEEQDEATIDMRRQFSESLFDGLWKEYKAIDARGYLSQVSEQRRELHLSSHVAHEALLAFLDTMSIVIDDRVDLVMTTPSRDLEVAIGHVTGFYRDLDSALAASLHMQLRGEDEPSGDFRGGEWLVWRRGAWDLRKQLPNVYALATTGPGQSDDTDV